jgi:hypothetical protein
MNRIPLLLVFAFALLSLAGRAAELPVVAVLRTDGLRLAAMMAGDGSALGRVFSDEIVFIHSDGRSEGKGDYIKNMTAGDTRYENVKTSDLEARQIAQDVVVLAGAQEMRKKLGADWSQINLRFMSVWRNESGMWRMVAWQSLRPAGNSVVPGK